jgi:hypothetical protein
MAEGEDSMNPLDILEHPDDVGQSEYRAIYECISDALSDVSDMVKKELAIAMLGEFEAWAKALKKRIKNP